MVATWAAGYKSSCTLPIESSNIGVRRLLPVFHPQFAGEQLRQKRVAQRGEGAGFAVVVQDLFEKRLRKPIEAGLKRLWWNDSRN